MTLHLDPIELAIQEIAAGRPVVVVDDEDRENEGDLVMAAELATPELVAFMIRHTSGILCTPLESAEAKRLQLTPMVAENDAPLSTAFTVSVDYRHGTTTGISAEERCATIRGLANGNSGAEDFVRPGHIFPLVARDGGVLMRTGHTEAAVDLAKLAGLRPVGLIAELVNDDGTVQKGQQVERFAKEHGFALVSIDDMIAYRQGREKLIERVEEREVETLVGPARAIVYSSRYDDAQHVALVFGSPDAAEAPMVRLHLENVVDDVFGGFEQQIWTALRKIKQDGDGVFIYLRSGAVGVAAPPPDDAEEMGAISAKTRKEHWRDVGLGAQIVRDLGLSQIRVLSTKDRQYVGAAGFGVEIVGTEIL
ncbi:MAG: 3,4-dihydroxy-2-butanone-4-phosphate synthase [Pseudomonadota bacterium]